MQQPMEPTLEELRAIGGTKWSMYPDAIGAFVAEMDYGVAPAIREALAQQAESGLYGYPPAWLLDDMREATSEFYRARYGWTPHDVQPLPDVIAGFQAAIEHYSAPGSKVILPTPAYMPFLKVPGLSGREILQVPMVREAEGSWRLDPGDLEQAFAAGGGLLVMCNPHNPIGKVYTKAEMREIADVVDRHSGRVFSDEIHAPLVYEGSVHVPYASVSEAAARHTVTATSASKAFNLPGLKCAQILFSNSADAVRWNDFGFFISHGAANTGIAANTAAYREGADWLADVVDYLDENRRLVGKLVEESLPGAEYRIPDGTYLAWIDCHALDLPRGMTPQRFFLEEAGVAMTDGLECGMVGEGAVRFNFATTRAIVEQAFAQMADAYLRQSRSPAVNSWQGSTELRGIYP